MEFYSVTALRSHASAVAISADRSRLSLHNEATLPCVCMHSAWRASLWDPKGVTSGCSRGHLALISSCQCVIDIHTAEMPWMEINIEDLAASNKDLHACAVTCHLQTVWPEERTCRWMQSNACPVVKYHERTQGIVTPLKIKQKAWWRMVQSIAVPERSQRRVHY